MTADSRAAGAACPTVPRIIHWWWDGGPPPPQYIRFRESWGGMHPDWHVEVWNETRWLGEFAEHPAAELYRGRSTYSPHAHEWGWKTNIARLVILQQHGGVWVDADLEPLRSIDPLVRRLEGPGAEGSMMAAREDRRYVNNAFLVSHRDGEFVTRAVDGLPSRVERNRNRTSMKATGPHYLTDLSEAYEGMVVLDSSVIYPMHWSELGKRGDTYPDAYTLHHWHRKTEEAETRKGRKHVPGQSGKRPEQQPEPRHPLRHQPRTMPGTRHGATIRRSGPTSRRHVVPPAGPAPTVAPARVGQHPRPPAPVDGLPRAIRDARGLTPDDVLLTLADLARVVPPGQNIVELGVYQGKSALALAWGAWSARGTQGAHVYGIDPWDLPGERFPWSELQDPTKPHRPAFTDAATREAAERSTAQGAPTGDYRGLITLIRDFSVNAGQGWCRGPVGLLYVDGDHRYDAVRADIMAWRERMAPGGVVAIDDYAPTHPEVARAVDDLVSEGILAKVAVYHGRLAVTAATHAPGATPPAVTENPHSFVPDWAAGMTVPQLRDIARRRGVILGDRRTRGEILAALAAAGVDGTGV